MKIRKERKITIEKILSELDKFPNKMIDLQTDIAINNVWDAFNEKGILNEKYLEGKIEAAIMKF